MKVGSTFTGAGGLDMAVAALWPDADTVWFSEDDAHAAAVFQHHHPDVPNLGDITTVDWTQVEPVDVIVGGFPCQPVSNAGKRQGEDDERWLWNDLLRAIATLHPRLVLLENVAAIRSTRSTVYDTPHKCVCGWPYRRGGVSDPVEVQWAGVVSEVGRGDDQAGAAAAGAPTGRVRGDGAAHSGGDRQVGRGVGVDDVRAGVGVGAARLDTAHADQEAAGPALSGSSTYPILVRGRGKHERDVDRGSVGGVRDDRPGDQGAEPQGAEGGRGAELGCEVCGRSAGVATDEPSERVALGRVLGSLAEIGFDAEWTVLRASDVGAPHRRSRWFAAAWPAGDPPGTGRQGATERRGEPEEPRQGRAGHVALLLTPTRQDGENTAGRSQFERNSLPLNAEVTMLPTPRSSDGPHGGPGQRNGRGVADSLPAIDALLPTPRSANADNRNDTVWERPDHLPQNLENALYRPHTDGRWGDYGPAVARWEQTLGRPAPPPTDDEGRLSPDFVEWMMGWPDGYTAVADTSRTQRLKMLGNGVVPHQAVHAYRHLFTAVAEEAGRV